MNDDRETTALELPVSKKQVVFKAYLTGRELRQISNTFIDAAPAEMTVSDGQVVLPGKKSLLSDLQEDAQIKACILSFDGKPASEIEDLPAVVLDLQKEDYQAVISKVKELSSAQKKT